MTLLNHHLSTTYTAAPNTIHSLLALRDLILLNISFFGLLRRSDAHSLKPSLIDIHQSNQYTLAHIPHSKTDQLKEGYTLPILLATQYYNWSHYLRIYLTHLHNSHILFPTYCSKTKTISYSTSLTKAGIARILPNRIKELVKLTDLEHIPNLASHSLRRGGATYFANHQAPDWLI